MFHPTGNLGIQTYWVAVGSRVGVIWGDSWRGTYKIVPGKRLVEIRQFAFIKSLLERLYFSARFARESPGCITYFCQFGGNAQTVGVGEFFREVGVRRIVGTDNPWLASGLRVISARGVGDVPGKDVASTSKGRFSSVGSPASLMIAMPSLRDIENAPITTIKKRRVKVRLSAIWRRGIIMMR
jgi:hypothetical protein